MPRWILRALLIENKWKMDLGEQLAVSSMLHIMHINIVLIIKSVYPGSVRNFFNFSWTLTQTNIFHSFQTTQLYFLKRKINWYQGQIKRKK